MAFLLLVLCVTVGAVPDRGLQVDVLVVGATPGGIAAAAAAARTGVRVHLVEALPKMGGVITWAWLTTFDTNLTPDGAHLTRGIALQKDGSVLANTLQVFGVNGLEPDSVAQGTLRAQRELPHVVRHLREHVPGSGRAELAGWAPMLYIRETRHITGLYTLTAHDILSGRMFPDRVALASYPIDIHPYVPGWVNPYPVARRTYSIPLRALVPVGVSNLLVASRSFSATSEAAGPARVVPTTMAMGQAAGVVAALCARRGCTPAEVTRSSALLAEVQRVLRAHGAYLGD